MGSSSEISEEQVKDSTENMFRTRSRSLNAIAIPQSPLESSLSEIGESLPLSPPSSSYSQARQSVITFTRSKKKTVQWEHTLEHAIKSVVSISTVQSRAFDTDHPGSFNATGFVVDSKLGLVLSNRHVVGVGPVEARGTFSDYEEIELKPLYRDPIHDFGFFKFDPSKLRYFKPEEIELAPEKAKVGTEIRVVGNDANEKLSIAQGTLARLDRPAPSYDVGSYNDFNTFYMQAASSTSGGSSGSPVLAIDGKAVALNAGASRVSSQSYYLPLDRIVRALNLIKQGNPDRAVTEFKGVEQNEPVCVPRGTILAEFKFIAIDEAKRLGLSFEHEKLIRTAKLVKMGVLVLNKVVQGGPSDGKLENGDIVVLVEDKLVNEFVGIESALDDNIGKKIKITVQRNTETLEFDIDVLDLEYFTPSAFLEFGDGILQDVSYQVARHYPIGIEGVYVACNGYTLSNANVPPKSIITCVNGVRVKSLQEFVNNLKTVRDGERVHIRFHRIQFKHKETSATFIMEKRFYRILLWQRNDYSGSWWKTEIETATSNGAMLEPFVNYEGLNTRMRSDSSESVVWKSPPGTPQHVQCRIQAAVVVETHVPFMVQGIHSSLFRGIGVIVGLNHPSNYGLVLCDRTCVPTEISRFYITFSNHNTVEGKLAFIHPTKPFAFISFPLDKADVFTAAPILDVDPGVLVGKPHSLVFFKNDTLSVKNVRVAAYGSLDVCHTSPPRFRPIRGDRLLFDDAIPPNDGGLLINDSGFVVGLWTGVCLNNQKFDCLSLVNLNFLIKKIMGYTKANVLKHVECEFNSITLSEAAKLGLPYAWIKRLSNASDNNKCLSVKAVFDKTDYRTDPYALLTGDIVLGCEGTMITRAFDIDIIEEKANDSINNFKVLVWRGSREVEVTAPLSASYVRFKRNVPQVDGTFLIGWCGMSLQCAYQEAVRQTFIPEFDAITLNELPYISGILKGSESEMVGLTSGLYILSMGYEMEAMQDIEIESRIRRKIKEIEMAYHCELPIFVKKFVTGIMGSKLYCKKNNMEENCLRLKTMNRNGVRSVHSIKPKTQLWPNWLLIPGVDGNDLVVQLHI